MIAPHMPFQDGSKHAANEYCPTCHAGMDRTLWDEEGRYKPENQQSQTETGAERKCEKCGAKIPDVWSFSICNGCMTAAKISSEHSK